MSRCVLPLFLALFNPFNDAPFTPVALAPCEEYTKINEPWRNRAFNIHTFEDFPKNDLALKDSWWRFTGIGGDRVSNSCSPLFSGGTYHPIHMTFDLPTEESGNPVTGTAYARNQCVAYSIQLSVALCPGGFYVYKPLDHKYSGMGYVTYHSVCSPNPCGPLAECDNYGGCVCSSGYEFPSAQLPTVDSYGCIDIDECQRYSRPCGPYANCTNTIGGYECTCWTGFIANDTSLVPHENNPCIDVNECDDHNCGDGGVCINSLGTFECRCFAGFRSVPNGKHTCQDFDECENSTICGPDANCTNSLGWYNCTCSQGFQTIDPLMKAGVDNPCTDIEECSQTPHICGKETLCTNAPGTFHCACLDGYVASTGVLWQMNVTICESFEDVLNAIEPEEGQTQAEAFLEHIVTDLENHTGVVLDEMEVFGVNREDTQDHFSEGDAEIGSKILGIADLFVSAMVAPVQNETFKTVETPALVMTFLGIGPDNDGEGISSLTVKGQTMHINLRALADLNNGSASAGFLTLKGMERLLIPQYLETENTTKMCSDVFTAVLPSINTANLNEPVNFTIEHKEIIPESAFVTCVYWDEKSNTTGTGKQDEEEKVVERKRWSEEGCWITYTDENYTVCSCSHLSTFALIMQIGEPPAESVFLEWLNRICVIVGLFFFALAILTFLLCSLNPKINNTARLNLCLSLFFSHLLILWNDSYLKDEMACIVMAGILHFLVLAGFVWMLLEALQLYLLVRRLTKVKVIRKDGFPWFALYLIGYGVPLVVVGVSAAVYSDGYGDTGAGACWLTQERHFNWALTGPVITILVLNCVLFCATLWSLRATLANMRRGASQSKDTRMIIFKIVAQFVILGCTWIIGLYQSNLFFQVLFIILNSQQGTFLYIIHCLLNMEVRDEYIKWLNCIGIKIEEQGSVNDDSLAEEPDNTEESNEDRKK